MSDIIQFMGNNDLTPRQIVSELDIIYFLGRRMLKNVWR
jgi:hypothetical protein